MKEHILRELINDLRDIATKYHSSEQLRERIAHCVLLAFHDDAEWWKAHEASKPKWPEPPKTIYAQFTNSKGEVLAEFSEPTDEANKRMTKLSEKIDKGKEG